MRISLSRRTFFGAGAVLALSPMVASDTHGAEVGEPPRTGPPESHPLQDRALVDEIVGVSHFSIERVRALLAQAPDLAKAARDWGFGDWETALGAASHTGNREIALLLIEHGARPDIFTHAMLGNTDAVRAIIKAQPGIQRLQGPHGITLADHARAGGEPARQTLEYLLGVEGADDPPPNLPLSEEQRARYIGTYRYDDAPPEATVEIGWNDRLQVLTITHPGRFFQRLNHLGAHGFSPAGAPGVRVVFTSDAEQPASRFLVTAPRPLGSATRLT